MDALVIGTKIDPSKLGDRQIDCEVILCSNRGTIKKVMTDIYFDDLFSRMDSEIETPK